MTFDPIVRNGTVVTANETLRCDVAIADGRVAALGGCDTTPYEGILVKGWPISAIGARRMRRA